MATFSPFQNAVIGAVSAGTEHIVVDAKAGSGKSFTILAAVKRLMNDRDLDGGTLLMAFNKSIQEELSDKCRRASIPLGGYRGLTVKTFHSLGFGAWMKYMGRNVKIKVDAKKSWNLLKAASKNGIFPKEDVRRYGSFACKLVSYAKNEGVGCVIDGIKIANTFAVYERIFSHHCMQLPDEESKLAHGIELAMWLLRASAKQRTVVDFDDMLWLPVCFKANFFANRRVIVDELQDTNPLQLEIAVRSLRNRGGQFIGVGDPDQAIYGFRGADSNAFNAVIDRFGATVLPLSICYRCPKAVILAAQAVVPAIRAADNAIEGEVKHVDNYNADFFSGDDIAVLCRNNAPLVTMAYGMIRRNIAAFVLGRDIGVGLVKLIEKMQAVDIDSLIDRLKAYFEREKKAAEKIESDTKLSLLDDQQQCMQVFIENLTETNRTLAGLVRQIENLFSEDGDGVLLCSIHKSKGREWHTVCILDEHLMPSPFAKREWMQVQEKNLEYVAITRSQHTLCYIDSACWNDAK
jgi:superfamily I DNA/RNA helicase